MLEQIIPQRELRDLRARILADQGRCYREQFIDTVQPIPGTHELIQEIRRLGIRVAAISSCQRDELVQMKTDRIAPDLVVGHAAIYIAALHGIVSQYLHRRLRIRPEHATTWITTTCTMLVKGLK